MEDTLTRMAELQAEAEALLRKVDALRVGIDYCRHERVHLDLACQRLESAVWALGQTQAGHVLGSAFDSRREVHHA